MGLPVRPLLSFLAEISRRTRGPCLSLIVPARTYRLLPCLRKQSGPQYASMDSVVKAQQRSFKKGLLSTLDTTLSPVTVTEIRHYLRTNNISFHDGYSCIHVPSPFSLNPENCLFIDKTTGRFLCKDTLLEGSWQDYQDSLALILKEGYQYLSPDYMASLLGDSDSESGEEQMNDMEVRRIWDRAVWFSDLEEDDAQIIKTMFNISKIPNNTLKKFGVKCYFPTKSLVFSWNSPRDSSLKGLKLLSAECRDQCVHYIETTYPRPARYNNLFGLSVIGKKETEVVITSREVDSLAVHQATGVTTVALPRGITCLPPILLPYLEQFKRITLWLGDDLHSWEASKQFARKLNLKRCSLIRSGDKLPTPLQAFNEGLNLNKLLKTAFPANHKSIISFRQLREEVFGQLENVDQISGVKWARFPELNKLLKGHRKGELTIFTGSMPNEGDGFPVAPLEKDRVLNRSPANRSLREEAAFWSREMIDQKIKFDKFCPWDHFGENNSDKLKGSSYNSFRIKGLQRPTKKGAGQRGARDVASDGIQRCLYRGVVCCLPQAGIAVFAFITDQDCGDT
ncbi:twinkle, mitochondrial [Pelobates cultripes]|uniref:Twinkle, mitochondrial n=1 Tax=Pelobates cultripes TaxID=61616 RepID=A0AAD1TE24_PELCU|nr:twinkle, mitochondrial [Pelobates cultripes]